MRAPGRAVLTLVLALAALEGCGSSSVVSSTSRSARSSATSTAIAQAHPQVVEPVAGSAARAKTPAPPPADPSLPLGGPRPVGPATNTKAVAKGAPTDAQVREAIAKFHAAVERYHLDRLNLAGALLNPSQVPGGHYTVSIASVYTDYGRPVACGGVLHVPELGVANKTLPCGTEVVFIYNGRAVRVPVIDRGPYIAGRTWDLTGATAEALHFPGLGPIAWRLAP